MANQNQDNKHPFFRTERETSLFKEFIQEAEESLEDVTTRAREWCIANKGITIVGGAWSMRPIKDEDKRGPSSFERVYTLTYFAAK